MKKLNMVVLLLLLSIIAKAQVYINGAMGYTHGSKMIYNYNSHQNERYESNFLYFGINGGYKLNDWIAETGGMFNGAVIGNLLAGRSIVNHIHIMGGVGTEICGGVKVKPQGLIRFISGHFQGEVRYMPNTIQIGIGVIGFGGEDF